MIAACHLKYAARVGKDSFLDVLHPGPIDAHRNLVLGLAGNGAGVASDAFSVIDDKTVFHWLQALLQKCTSIILGCKRKRGYVGEPALQLQDDNC